MSLRSSSDSPANASSDPPASRSARRERNWRPVLVTLVVGLVLLGLMALGIAAALRVRSDPEAAGPVPLEELARPAPPPSGYVGNQACAECHGDIVERYQTHPMAHSLARIGQEKRVEDYQDASFSPTAAHRYMVEQSGEDEVRHHEMLVGPEGDIVYDHAEAVNYVLGSGQLGRAYLLERNGILYQSPIGWYEQQERWDLSPNYDPLFHPRFHRRIGDGCLYCHAGQVDSVQPGSDRYEQPPFVHESISCERCHGPGKEHVERQRSATKPIRDDDTIVNPARLDADRRDAVCFQCHLQGEAVIPRYGRTFFDFRPGQRLEDNWVIFVGKTRVGEQGETRAVSHVEQMRSSRCYVASERRMTCTTCHDPHFSPPPEQKTAFYQASCLKCHEPEGCGLEQAQRLAAPANGSCIHCHMPQLPSEDVPHTTQTDHRILRRPDAAASPDTELRVPIEQAVVFDGAEERLPKRSVDRARAIALSSKEASGGAEVGRRIEELLLAGNVLADDVSAGLRMLGDDTVALVALGTACRLQGRGYEATICWQEALRYDADDEEALTLLTLHHHEKGDVQTALEYMDRLIALTPDVPTLHGRRAHMLGQVGDMDEAVRSAYRALELDPTLNQIRQWLVEVHTIREEPEKAARQQEMIRLVTEALARIQPPGDGGQGSGTGRVRGVRSPRATEQNAPKGIPRSAGRVHRQRHPHGTRRSPVVSRAVAENAFWCVRTRP